MNECEILIIGAGITGLTIANELVEKGIENILVIEKEGWVGLHASGRNSGVLHSGIYYTPDTLKAKFCAEGNRLITEYCLRNNLTLLKTGKVITASDQTKLDALDLLQDRASKNGVRSRFISARELEKIEPYAYTYKKAIFSPDTSVFNPTEILESFVGKLRSSNKVKFLFNTEFNNANGSEVITSRGKIRYKKMVNAAGSFADRIAHSLGISEDYKILPFIGTYNKLAKKSSHYVRGNIYPVPDMRNPFLGVHLTKGADGVVYIGPTAIPAIGRESYGFLKDISFESLSILYSDFILFIKNDAFRDNALNEIRKILSSYVFKEAKKLVPKLEKSDILRSTKAGIRPQLVHWPTKSLVMDFLIVKEGETVHILNAISPAFTSSMSFAKCVVDKYLTD